MISVRACVCVCELPEWTKAIFAELIGGDCFLLHPIRKGTSEIFREREREQINELLYICTRISTYVYMCV